MSNTIRIYEDKYGDRMQVTAFVGGSIDVCGRNSVQLSMIESDHISLSQKQTADLICTLTNRIANIIKYNATESTDPEIIYP
jgi:hypothetical protein